jgi:hypothetical protein
VGGSLLAAAVALLFLRTAAPALFQDAKDVEALLPIASLLAAAGLLLFEGRKGGRVLHGLLVLGIVWFGAAASVSAYAARFLALGR